ncbi:MAG: methyltransferase domain-containing protein [Candidatus Levybacteria bacterium]|nr:methyltransferase domain-containing protein [Candidatus Levybacteria bacterium]
MKESFAYIGIDINRFIQVISKFSIYLALFRNGQRELLKKLREIVPDISNQESSGKDTFNDYWEINHRALQAFQCYLMLRVLEYLPTGKLTVVDIGDSAGTHMLYLRELTKDKFDVDTISVNLDPRAIKKIKARGLKAILCRAEELDLGQNAVDLFTSFEMVEHLHNPAIFFRRLAKKSPCNKIVITVPYLKDSRVGLHHIRNRTGKIIFAEDEHIFELSPEDWTLLILHSGWRVVYSEVYYQYPRQLPVISQLLSWFWRNTDFEGFWGAILEKDTTLSDLYQDWDD